MNSMNRVLPWSDQVDVISSDESSSSSSLDVEIQVNDGTTNVTIDQPSKELSSEGNFLKSVSNFLPID